MWTVHRRNLLRTASFTSSASSILTISVDTANTSTPTTTPTETSTRRLSVPRAASDDVLAHRTRRQERRARGQPRTPGSRAPAWTAMRAPSILPSRRRSTTRLTIVANDVRGRVTQREAGQPPVERQVQEVRARCSRPPRSRSPARACACPASRRTFASAVGTPEKNGRPTANACSVRAMFSVSFASANRAAGAGSRWGSRAPGSRAPPAR